MSSQPQVTSGLQWQINAFIAKSAEAGPRNPDAQAAVGKMLEDLIKSDAVKASVQTSAQAPDFSLPNVDGKTIQLSDLLQAGPVVITFYRGEWCPFCNLTLRAYEAILPQIKANGATLVAISPQTPDYSILTVQNKALTFPVLSDVGSHTARQYGLAYTIPEDVRPYSANLVQFNGNADWVLPMPGTFVVDQSGKVTLAFVDANFMKRLEPQAILDALAVLQPSR